MGLYRLSNLQDFEKFRQHVEQLKSVISPMETILSRYLLSEMSEIYHCHLCEAVIAGASVHNLTAHLFGTHGLTRRKTPKEFVGYFAKFGVPVCACGCGKPTKLHCRRLHYNLFAVGCKNASKFRNPACPEFHLFKGLSVDDTITAIKQIQSKEISDVHKTKLHFANIGQNNPMSMTTLMRENGWEAEATKEFLKARATYGFKGKKHRPESLAKLAKRRAEQHKTITKPEMIIWGMLQALGISFQYQMPIERYIVDFLCGNTIIEVFGDYWHNRNESQAKDDVKVKLYESLGYEVVILWESQILLQPKDVVGILKAKL